MIETHEVVLRKIALRIALQVDGLLLESQVDIDRMASYLGHKYQAVLRGHLLGTDLKPHTYTHPATWWDAFKVAHFPDWARRRWPPHHTTVAWTVAAVYPDFKVAIPDHQAAFVVTGPIARRDDAALD